MVVGHRVKIYKGWVLQKVYRVDKKQFPLRTINKNGSVIKWTVQLMAKEVTGSMRGEE
mgnify:CR=1 FL=1